MVSAGSAALPFYEPAHPTHHRPKIERLDRDSYCQRKLITKCRADLKDFRIDDEVFREKKNCIPGFCRKNRRASWELQRLTVTFFERRKAAYLAFVEKVWDDCVSPRQICSTPSLKEARSDHLYSSKQVDVLHQLIVTSSRGYLDMPKSLVCTNPQTM